MAHSTRTLRIGTASLVAIVMVGGTFALTGPDPLFGLGRVAEAQSSEELLREYAAKDTDSDSLPDWQEALYGTDPTNPESFQAGIKDGDAVAQGLIQPKVAVRAEDEMTDIETIPGAVAAPNSLTDRFAQTLLKQYLQNRGETPPTSEEIVTFVEAGIQNLVAESDSSARYALADVKLSGETGTIGLQSYAAQMESAFARNTVAANRNELSYFSDALNGDTASLKKIREISQAYKDIASALIAVPVPSEARQAHLSIANALVHMSETSADMAAMETDPLRALMGIGLYEKYATELVAGFSNLHGVFSARQVSVPQGSAGYHVIKTAADAATSN